jgi:coniferyl-aldehyde dehydrogenase
VLLDPPEDSLVMREEIFGPLLPVKSYDDFNEAVDYVLARDKPLPSMPSTATPTRVERVLERVSAGMACVNDVLIQFGQSDFPIGGVGASGMGAYHGHTGFLAFSKQMPVLYQSRLNGMKLFDPPYSNFTAPPGALADWRLKAHRRVSRKYARWRAYRFLQTARRPA